MFRPRFIHRRMHSVWRTLMCLALCGFVLRAMVPAGFMVDPGTAKNQVVRVTFCSADPATAHLALNFDQQKKSGQSHHTGSMGCPFAILAIQALGMSAAHVDVSAPVLAELGNVFPIPHRVLLRLAESGPPLGSRAPPLRLA